MDGLFSEDVNLTVEVVYHFADPFLQTLTRLFCKLYRNTSLGYLCYDKVKISS